LQTAQDVLGGHEIRVIVDRRRCFVQTTISGCPSSFFNGSIVSNLVATLPPVPTPVGYPGFIESFSDLIKIFHWTLPTLNEAGIAIYFVRTADSIDPTDIHDWLFIQLGNGNGPANDFTTVSIDVSSTDLLQAYTNLISDPVFTFGPGIIDGHISGTISNYANNNDPTGLAIGPFPPGGCVTVKIGNYTGLKQIAIGSFDSARKDVRSSLVLNSTQLASGQTFEFDLCICQDPGTTPVCPTQIPPTTGTSTESFFEEAIDSLPVQIVLGTVGTALAIGAGVGIWCFIKKKSKSSEKKEYTKL